jgi:integrase
MRKGITAGNVNGFPLGEVWDTYADNLVLRVGKRRKTWQVRLKIAGRSHRETIGHFPAVGIREARDKAREILERFEAGVPLHITTPAPQADTLTVRDLLEKYRNWRATEGTRTKSLDEGLKHIRRGLDPYLNLPVTNLAKADVRAARDSFIERGSVVSGNRFLAYLGPVMRWAAQEDIIDHNFIPDIRRMKETGRQRILSDPEIAQLWQATHGDKNSSFAAFCRLVRFLLVSAQRRSEASQLRWEHVQGETWHQSDNKSGRPHDVPLTPLALSQMGERGEGLVFNGESGSLQGWSKLKARLDCFCPLPAWTLHDLRRSAASGMQGLNFDEAVIRAVLNHSVPGVTGRYLKATMTEQKRLALQGWADHIEGLI